MSMQLHFLAQYKSADITIQSIAQELAQPDRLFSCKKTSILGDVTRLQTSDNFLKVDISAYQVHQSNTAFDVVVQCSDIEQLEYMRYWTADVLKSRTMADQVYLIEDGVTEHIAGRIYPLLHKIETQLRKYLIRFFLKVVGDQWLRVTAPKDVIDRVGSRMGRTRDKWDQLIVNDLYYLDFYELGLLITKQSTGFNDPSSIVGRIQSISTLEQLHDLQRDMETNYTKYFHDTFMQHQFHKIWPELYQLRNKVAHNNILTSDDLNKVEQSVAQLRDIIRAAETKMNDVILTSEEEFLIEDYVAPEGSDTTDSDDYTDLLPKLKILGRIDIHDIRRKDQPEAIGESTSSLSFIQTAVIGESSAIDEDEWIIEEDEFLSAMKEYLKDAHFNQSRFLALSTMLNKLEDEGYNRESCRKMAFQLDRDGKVEIYDYEEKFSMRSCKAIRVVEG